MEETYSDSEAVTVEDEGQGDPLDDIGDPTGEPWDDDEEGDDDGAA